MTRSKARTVRPAVARTPEDGLDGLLVPLGVLAALVLPYFVFSVASSDALHESKVLVQALGCATALAGLAAASKAEAPPGPGARPALLALAGAALLALVSATRAASRVDPLNAASALPLLALVYLGGTRLGARIAPRVLAALAVAGAFSGILAGAQRFAGLLRLPLEAPEPRFFASALIGSPGDVAAALLVPGLYLWMEAGSSAAAPSRRLVATAGLGAILVGLLTTETVTPLLALAVGAVVHVLLRPRTRWKPFLAAAVLGLAAVSLTGAGRRVLVKLDQLRAGKVAAASTQRDIGVLSALEMVRAHPLLGVGPGVFSNAFVPARLAAEARAGRRLVHDSGSGHFENAHSEPLTLAAECGLPAAALGIAGVAITLFLLSRAARREDEPEIAASAETPLVLLAGLAALSLADFPLRLAVTSGPAAFLLGLALRRGGGPGERPDRPPRRALLAAATVVVAGLAIARGLATLWQARGEIALQAIVLLPPAAQPDRAYLLDEARLPLERSLSIRPRSASALLAFGSTRRLGGDARAALSLYRRSLALEERAETDLNLGAASLAAGSKDNARMFFVRAVWLLPRLLESLPPEVDARAVEAEIRSLEAGLRSTRITPPLPAGFGGGL